MSGHGSGAKGGGDTSGPDGGPGVRLSSARGRWVMSCVVLASGMAMLDGTVVNVALPRMGRDLDASLSGLQWVVNAYMLTLSALLLLGARWGTGSAASGRWSSAWCGSRWRPRCAGSPRTTRR